MGVLIMGAAESISNAVSRCDRIQSKTTRICALTATRLCVAAGAEEAFSIDFLLCADKNIARLGTLRLLPAARGKVVDCFTSGDYIYCSSS
mmetsp:Transcript_12529/g.30505  ORF Transcript_12529/g.30505 Transcript_12529/m.30505 type:complete len:91 (+) Transcript_12529:2395-2667(+)